MENTLNSTEAATVDAGVVSTIETPAKTAVEDTAAAPAPKLKSAKFFYVGIAWALGYPSTACLIGYLVFLSSGNGPQVA